MLVDLHTHSSGISQCCRANAAQALEAARGAGIDGIVLTNHYQSREAGSDSSALFARRYVEEFYRAKQLGEGMGMPVLFGIEVTMERHENQHLLVYGVDEEFPLRHPDLFLLTQRELYDTVHKEDGLLIQAHPFRRGKDVMMDLSCLDGVEVNCHPLYDATHHQRLADIAASHGKLLTCGGDYHADTHRAKCGVYLPEDITDGVQLGRYLKEAKTLTLCIQEVGETTPFDQTYTQL